MRRIAVSCLCLALSGCGYNTWWNPPFTTGSNPNAPVGDSENMRRVMGEQVEPPLLTTEPGDVWPGPLPPEPTLQELEQQTGQTAQPEQPVPGSPEFEQNRGAPNLPPPPANRGSSTPPGSNQPPLAPLPNPAAPQATNPVPPPPRNPAGQVYQTPAGPTVTNGGTSGYQTTTTPGGGSAIVVPNGNGTSTIIHSDGKIETVPTPR
ncbi:MAG TPA: hypothetical protein VHT74_16015 [Acetobacteraceae bacterium]|jgi:hypothetical protein|nr:hypothetical protein [Acetobacteraceae bacterium]